MGWTVAATLIASAVAAATARAQHQAAQRSTSVLSAAQQRAMDIEVASQGADRVERDRAAVEAKAQYDAQQQQLAEDRAIEQRRYEEEKARLDLEQKRRDDETARQTRLDAETLAARQAEFNFLKQQYADRQGRITAGLAGFEQRYGGGGPTGPAPGPRTPFAEMPPDWKPGDSIFAGGDPNASMPVPSIDSSQFPVQLSDAAPVPAASTGALPLSTFVNRRAVPPRATSTMSEAAYQGLAAPRAPARAPLSALVKAKKARVA